MLYTLKLFWFTVDSSVPLNEGIQFFFMTSAIVLFLLLIV